MNNKFNNYDLVAHLYRQRAFSRSTFGPGDRKVGIIDHISKELNEVLTAKNEHETLEEWVDIILLALDGAWRLGYTPEEIAMAIESKQSINEHRNWPDWRTQNKDAAITHV